MAGDARRAAIVTGAAGGIGAAIVGWLLDHDTAVLGMDVDGDGLRRSDPRMVPFHGDAAEGADVRAAVGHVVAQFGRLDIAVANAGIQLPRTVDVLADEEWDRIQRINLRAAFLLIRACLPFLRESPAGSIITVASIDGLVGEAGVAPYAAAKAGLVNLTRSVAMDLGPAGIRVNCVCPGMTDTPMFRSFVAQAGDPDATLRHRLRRVPLGRLVRPAEVAAAVGFLAGDEASGMTGSTLVVDAGVTAGWDYPGSISAPD